MKTLQLRYFAALRERAGRASEAWTSDAADAAALYRELAGPRQFGLAQSQLRVAINGEFADWDAPLADGDEVVFLPPVSGG